MASSSAFRKLQAIADQQEPALRRAYMEAIAEIQKATSALRIAAAIERGDVAAVNHILNDAHLARQLRKVADIIRQLTVQAGRLATVAIAPNTQIAASMSQVNPAAVRAAEQQAARMVTRVSRETKNAIRDVIAESVKGGLTPQKAAQQIKPLIGLTAQQAKAVTRYRRELEAAGRAAADIDRLVERYTQQLLRQRARTIARTETQAAANAGQQAIWQQAQQNGLLPENARRRWIVTPDDRLCPNCAPLDGQTAKLNEPFHTAFGPVMNPPLHPNCRCAMSLDVASLAAARGLRVAVAA